MVLWAELFASLGSKRTVNYSVVALLIAAVAYFAIRLLPVDAAQLAVALLPAASMGCFLHYKRSVPRLPRRERNMRVKARPPLRLVKMCIRDRFGAARKDHDGI